MKKEILFKDIRDFYTFTDMFVRIKRELLLGRYPINHLLERFKTKNKIASVFKSSFKEINIKGKLMDDNNMSSIILSLSEEEIQLSKIFIEDSLNELNKQKEIDTEDYPEILKETLSNNERIDREVDEYEKLNEVFEI